MHTLQSGGRTVRVLRAEPVLPGDSRQGRLPAVLLLHGAGGNVPFWFNRLAPQVTALGCLAYAVHYFDRTGTTRAELALIRDGVHVPLWAETIRDTLRHIAADPQVDPERIALVGISLGGFLALSLGAESFPDGLAISTIVEIAGGLIAPSRALVTRHFPPTLIVHGDRDAVVAVSQAHALAAQLEQLGVEHQTVILPGETHWFTPRAQEQILELSTQFLAKHLVPQPVAVS